MTTAVDIKVSDLFPVTNEELARAIDVSHQCTRATSETEPIHLAWKTHLRNLLEIQRKRAEAVR